MQKNSKSQEPLDIGSDEQQFIKSGLLFENGINRGINYTDNAGSEFNLRYIPISIVNDSTVPIQIQINFSENYDYMFESDSAQFKMIPLPAEWGLDGIGVTEKMLAELRDYINNPVMANTISPGEELVIGIGALYPRPPKFSGILPRELFDYRGSRMFPECEWFLNGEKSSDRGNKLGLKLVSGENCIKIPCGYISYPE